MSEISQLTQDGNNCLTELTKSPNREVVNGFNTVEKYIFDLYCGVNSQLMSHCNSTDIVQALEYKSAYVNSDKLSRTSGFMANMFLANIIPHKRLSLQLSTGYLCAVLQVITRQSDNPIEYASNPHNYSTIRRDLFANKGDAISFAGVRRDVGLAELAAIPDFILPLVKLGLDRVGRSGQLEGDMVRKRYDFDLAQIDLAYR